MKPTRIVPVNRPREFDLAQLFFSTTNRKGIIEGCNDVFRDISAYSSEELLGRPHNVIRHPDMPKCVFKLMWSYILDGRPLGAYVKNMAKTGEHYWVFALVLPIESGFLSIRLKPTSELFAAVPGIYRELLEKERESGDDWRQGMDDSGDLLPVLLTRLGFASYEEFMSQALHTEVRSREEKLGLGADEASGQSAREQFEADIDKLREIRGSLLQGTSLERVSGDVTKVALNARVAAARLSERGRALGVIGEHISRAAVLVRDQAVELSEVVRDLSRVLHDTSFHASGSLLVREMQLAFDSSRANEESSEEEQVQSFGATFESLAAVLHDSYESSLQRRRQNLDALTESLGRFRRSNTALSRIAVNLELGHVTGKTICAHLEDSIQFAQLLEQAAVLSKDLRTELWGQEEAVRGVHQLVGRWRAADGLC